jgi:hypothetical protein
MPKIYILCILVILLSGCGNGRESGPPQSQPEFVLRDIPAVTYSHDQGYDVYEITGHGQKCYVAGFGVSKTLLWCERIKQ